MLWIRNFVSLFISFPKCLRIAPFILLYVCNLSSKSLLYFDILYPQVFKICYLFNNIVVYRNFYPLYVVSTHCHWFSFVLDIVILYFLAIRLPNSVGNTAGRESTRHSPSPLLPAIHAIKELMTSQIIVLAWRMLIFKSCQPFPYRLEPSLSPPLGICSRPNCYIYYSPLNISVLKRSHIHY